MTGVRGIAGGVVRMRTRSRSGPLGIGRRLGVAAAFFGLLMGGLMAATPGEVIPRLREAIRMPEIELSAEFGFNAEEGLNAWDPVPDPVAEVRRLAGTLSGGSGDALILDRMASLQEAAGQTNAAARSRDEAARVAREAVSRNPDDPRAKIHLGWVLPPTQSEEAERLLRAAVAKAPEDPVCLVTFGRWLTRGLLRERVFPCVIEGIPDSAAQRSQHLQERIAEARALFDRAVTAAPGDLEARVQRMMFHWFRASGVLGTDAADADSPGPGIDVAVFHGYVLPDLRKARQLAPEDFRLIALRIWATLMGELGGRAADAQGLPEPVRQEAVTGMDELRRLAVASDQPGRAAAIWEVMAVMQLTLLDDSTGAAENAARSLNLQPGRPRAWIVRASALKEAGRNDELLQFLEGTLQRTNSVTLRLMLAKVAVRSGNPAVAREQVAAARQLDPDELRARACEIALRLRETLSDAELSAVGERIQESLERLPRWEPASQRAGLSENLGVSAAVSFGLAGEWSQARDFLGQVRSQFPDSAYVRGIAAILDGAPSP